MNWRLLEDDPVKTEWFRYDDQTGESITKTVYKGTQDVVDLNKAVQGRDVAKGKDGDWWHVASVPMSVIHQWLQEGINIWDRGDWPAVARKLDSNEWRHLRVNTGQLGIRKKIQ